MSAERVDWVRYCALSDPLPPLPDRAHGVAELADLSLVAAVLRRGDSPHTRRAYAGDLASFARWLASQDLRFAEASEDALCRYRDHLVATYATSTANRRLTVVRALYDEAERCGAVPTSPAARLRSVRGRDDHDGGVLTHDEAQALVTSIAAERTIAGRAVRATRDLALISLLLRTGLRRAELASLRCDQLEIRQGHRVLQVRGKGNVRRTVKLPPDVADAIDAWLASAADARLELRSRDPLFVVVRKGDHPIRRALADRDVYRVVALRLARAGLPPVGVHALRATFVTLALEAGAPLHLVQHAAGHADPRTTERYWRRKSSLEVNAVDYLRITVGPAK